MATERGNKSGRITFEAKKLHTGQNEPSQARAEKIKAGKPAKQQDPKPKKVEVGGGVMGTEDRQRHADIEHAKKIQAGKPNKVGEDKPSNQREADPDRGERMRSGKPDTPKK